MADQGFPPQFRIRSSSDFERTFRQRCTAADADLRLFAAPNALPHARLGLSVSKKVGNAVRRNCWKRLLREAFRLSRVNLPAGLDLVVIPQPQAVPSLPRLLRSLPRLARRAAGKLQQDRPAQPPASAPGPAGAGGSGDG